MADTPADDLARTLVANKALTAEQLRECQAVAADTPDETGFVDVAMRRGYLDAAQVEAARTQIEKERARTVALRRDAAVAKLALKRQFVTRERVEECRREQLALQKQGADATLLQTLVDKGYLSDEQAQIVTAAVGEEGRRLLGDFEIIRKLGQGGMGAVYKARQVSMDRIVALKVLPPRLAADEMFVKRFYREAQACAKLDHPNVIRGLAVGEADGHHYFAMEFVDGRSLKDIIDREGPMPVWRAVPIFIDVARGLAHAHQRDLIHRDIKPDNIMLTREGVPKLADMGLAKETSADRSAITESGTAMGTAYYMPPEQAKDAKRADKRSDIYALGATFYHVVTGKVPYEGDSSFEVMRAHESASLTPPRKHNPDVPERLSLIIEKMMNKNPDFRFKSAEEVADALEQVEVAKPASARTPVGEKPRLEVTRPPADLERTRGELWYVGLPGPTGKPTTREFDLPMLQRFIEEGRLPLDAPVRKGKTGPFKTMDRFPQLARALRQRRGRDQDHKGRRESFKNIYEEYDRRLARQALMRKIKRAASWLVGLIIVAAAAWAAVTYVVPMLNK